MEDAENDGNWSELRTKRKAWKILDMQSPASMKVLVQKKLLEELTQKLLILLGFKVLFRKMQALK